MDYLVVFDGQFHLGTWVPYSSKQVNQKRSVIITALWQLAVHLHAKEEVPVLEPSAMFVPSHNPDEGGSGSSWGKVEDRAGCHW